MSSLTLRTAALSALCSLLVVTSANAQSRTPPSSPASSVTSSLARITLRSDTGAAIQFIARAFELRVAQGTSTAEASIRLVKGAGPSTADLVRLSGNFTVVPNATIELFDTLASPSLTLRLSGITVSSDVVALSTARVALDQQRIGQQEVMSQLTADYQDAERQLATLEELGKTRVATRLDIARARDRASDLRQRLDLLKERQALVRRQFESSSGIEETVVLHFDRLEIEDTATGLRSVVSTNVRSPGRPRS